MKSGNLIPGEKPESVTLSQNYPNPFNPTTEINYTVDQKTEVNLTIYNLLGRKVVTLVNDKVQSQGSYTQQFDASKLSSGVYIYRLSVDDEVMTKKMTLIK
jgi:hypothetical protein